MLKNTFLKCSLTASMLTLVLAYITGEAFPVRSCIAAGIALSYIGLFVVANYQTEDGEEEIEE